MADIRLDNIQRSLSGTRSGKQPSSTSPAVFPGHLTCTPHLFPQTTNGSQRKYSVKAVNKRFLSGISHRCRGPWRWCRDAWNTPTLTQLWGPSPGFNHARLSGQRQTVRVHHCNFVASIHLNHSQTVLSPQGAETEANSHRRSKWRVMKDKSLPGKYTMWQPS